jgi:REP element-mobilizing transposase RayT
MNMRKPKTGQRALRRGRVSLPDHRYLVTMVCEKRRRCFDSARVAIAVSVLLQEQRTWRNSTPICWVLMPDHLHVLLQLAGDESLSHLVNRLKSVSARAATDAACGFKPVWMRGFHDRAMRNEAECEIAARYVLENPVRAGLVVRAEDYPYRACLWEPDGPGW